MGIKAVKINGESVEFDDGRMTSFSGHISKFTGTLIDNDKLPPLYKVLNSGGRSFHGGSMKYPLPEGDQPGEWVSVDRVLMCRRGFHITDIHFLDRWYSTGDRQRVFRVEVDGPVMAEDRGMSTKYVAARMRLLYEVTVPRNALRHYVAAFDDTNIRRGITNRIVSDLVTADTRRLVEAAYNDGTVTKEIVTPILTALDQKGPIKRINAARAHYTRIKNVARYLIALGMSEAAAPFVEAEKSLAPAFPALVPSYYYYGDEQIRRYSNYPSVNKRMVAAEIDKAVAAARREWEAKQKPTLTELPRKGRAK